MHTMTGECSCQHLQGRTGQGGAGRRGPQSKQEDRRFHTPESREGTERGNVPAVREPTGQRSGGLSPTRFQPALNQACTWEGEPWTSGFPMCLVCQDRGERAHTRQSCLPAGGRAGSGLRAAALPCVVEVLDGRAVEKRLAGERSGP